MYCLLRPCFQMCFRLFSRVKLKHVCIGVGIIFVFDFFGVFTHMFEKSFDESFVYPYEGDIHEFILSLRHNQKPDVPPINEYNYSYIDDVRNKCLEPNVRSLRIVFLIKSAVENFKRRMAIRKSWGYEKRFSDVSYKTVFLLGTHPGDDELRAKINLESVEYQDLVIADFVDTYYNNTIKTMMGFKWAIQHCSNAKFYMFVDDDIYISVKNVLRFIRNPALYPDYLKDSIKFRDLEHLKGFKRNKRSTIKNQSTSEKNYNNTKLLDFHNITHNELNSINNKDFIKEIIPNRLSINTTRTNNGLKLRGKRQVFDIELPDDVRLFAGFVFVSAPHRHKSSKWYVSLKEYPYHLWPPYVTAGAFILSKEAFLDMYYASMYTKHFRFDDIFLGLVARKADIEPFHCEEFHFYKKDYTKFNYKYVISSHGYGDPEELLQVWNEQKALGNA